jgi:predicted RNA-binding protein
LSRWNNTENKEYIENGLTWKVEVKLPDLGLETAEELRLARYRTQREGVGHLI